MVLKRLTSRLPETAWGFPLGPKEPARPRDPEAPRRGIALLTAIMVIATMVIFTADMIITSSVNLKLAVKNRDSVKAEYLAKSGLNLALFMITADLGIDLFQFQMQKTPPTDGSGDIWGMLNGLPIGGESLEMLGEMQEQFNLSKVNDSGILDQLKLFDGQFAINIEDETKRINVNYCGEGQSTECLGMLEALMSCPAEKEFLNKKKLNPREVAANIKDWVDDNTRPVEGWSTAGSEEAPYEKRDPKVVPKNAPLDSLDELKQVEGWDEDMHTVFSPYLTIYPIPPPGVQAKPKVNLNTAPKEVLFCLLPQTQGTCAEKATKFVNPAKPEDEPDNVTNPQDIQKRLTEVFCESDAKKAKWFTYRTDTFRVQATGSVGDHETTLETIVKRGLPDEQEKKDDFKGSYRFLYWKML